MSNRKWRKRLNAILSFSLVAGLALPTVTTPVEAASNASELLISEYIEGGSFNKAIELYNGTGTTVDLSDYSLELYSNGATQATNTLDLGGTLVNGETYVIHHGSAAEDIQEKGDLANSSVINFNGDDALVLKKLEEVIDSIGQVGERIENLKDVTLVRNSSITFGETVIDDAFDPAVEWTVFPKDDSTNLGTHVMDGTGSENPPTDPEEPAEPEVTVVETLDEARVRVGETIQVDGTVTTGTGYWGGNGFYLQDETAGIYVYGSSEVSQGDTIQLIGEVTTYANESQIQPESVVVLSSGNELPEIQTVLPSEVNEDTQGELVTVENVKITDIEEQAYGTFEFTAVNADGESIIVRHDNRTGSAYNDFVLSFSEGDLVHITGIASKFNDTYQLKPRGLEDYELVNKPAVYTEVFPGVVAEGTEVSLQSSWENATIYYTLDGSTPTAKSNEYTEAILLTEDTTIQAIAVGADTSEVFTFDYSVVKSENVNIRDIQGKSHFTAYTGQLVSDVEGVVTYVADKNNFYMQDPNPDNDLATSEGILVYNRAHGLEPGDHISVDGKGTEWYIEGYADMKETDLPTTELTNTTIEKLGTLPVPEPIVIGVDVVPPSEMIDNDNLTEFDPTEVGIDFWESLEGMLVSVPNAQVVGPQKYGEVVVVAENSPNTEFHKQGGILISENDYNPEKITIDLNNEAYVAKAGDSYNGDIVGPISYGYGNYKLLTKTSTLPDLIEGDTKPETTWIEADEEKLTVATYNVENFSADPLHTSDEKAQRIAQTFVENMKSPDIIALVEVQDNDGPKETDDADAAESYQRLIAAIEAAGGPAYRYTDIAPEYNQDGGQPGGNIRVGFLYNLERVSLVEGTKGEATEANTWDADGDLVLNPGRIAPTEHPNTRKPLAGQFEFQGEKVVVIAHHLNSKSGDQPLFGQNQLPYLGSEAERIELATIMNDFIEEGLAHDPDLNVVVAGDMNDFEFTPALDALQGDILTNMVEEVPVEDRYSYYYQGNSQVLDHILVTNNLKEQTEVDMIHINSMFMEEHGRASDHDPVLVQIDLTSAESEPDEGDQDEDEDDIAPVEVKKTYDYKNYHKKKLTLSSPSIAVNLEGKSNLSKGVFINPSVQYARLTGDGFKDVTLTIKPSKKGTVLDFTGIEVEKVIINGAGVEEIRGAEKVLNNIEYKKGASADSILFTNSDGEPIGSLLNPEEPTPEVPNEEEQNPGGQDPEEPNPDENPTPLEMYYQSAFEKEGEALKTALHEIIDDHDTLSYRQVWEALRETDEDSNNPDNVILFYSGDSRSEDLNGGMVGDWNREHVWAKSHGDFGTSQGPGTDIHHLRPTDVQVNSSRGNLDFDYGGTSVKNCDDCLRSSNSFEPPNDVKGDVARMLFYMAVRYEGDDGYADLELNELLNNGSNPYHGKLSVLLEWHEQDPVDEFEKNRNDVIEEWQGNRNPFIDHPEWANSIW